MPMYRVSPSFTRFEPASTALIVVDMQGIFLAPGAALEVPAGRDLLPTLQRAVVGARNCGIRVVHTRVPRFGEFEPELFEFYPGAEPAPGDVVITKPRYSGFYNTELDAVLRGASIDTVVIAGVSTENCCHATARDAHFRGYRVAFLADATGTFDYPDCGAGTLTASEVHRATLVILAASTAHVMTTAEFLARAAPAVAAPATGA
jgi:biuret amidohydrolase